MEDTGSSHLTQLLWRFVGIAALLSLLPVAHLIWSGLVEVDQGHAAILIKKTGLDLPDGEIAAPSPEYKGVQLKMLPEGWHMLNPYTYETKVVPQVEIPSGKVGVRTRLFGKPPPAGIALAGDGEKGIEHEILKPGRYAINTLLYKVDLTEAVNIPSGHVGVVTRVTGKDPVDPNVFVVQDGERGVQPRTFPPGTHYLNPYEFWVVPIDMRSHRFDMHDGNVVEFLSKDGFQIRMEASIEWFIDPIRVPNVFVEYVDARAIKDGVGSADEVIKCIVETVLLPNARAFSRIEGSKHLARDFISGETRQKFQDSMLKGLKAACASQGIVIQTALVRKTEPPKAIADPIREREIAIRQREKLEQEMEREKQQKTLAQSVKMQERVKLIKQAEADVAVAITESNRQKEVALIEASRKFEVAKLELEAAKNQAAARLSAGQAAADVLALRNKAESSGIKAARAAFGDGEGYVRYLFLRKIAPAMQQVISNTDGPFVDVFRAFAPSKTGATAPVR